MSAITAVHEQMKEVPRDRHIAMAIELLDGLKEILKAHKNSIPCTDNGPFNLTLKLNPETVRALQYLGAQHYTGKKKYFKKEFLIANLAIKFAISQPDEFSKWIGSVLDYSEAEGLEFDSHLNQLIAGHKAYRRRPLPTDWMA